MNEVYHQMTLDEWDKIVEETKWHLNNIANSFILIGYNLKQIRDQEAYRLKGYTSMSEFAEKELRISKSTVSRAIQINEKYADGKKVRPEYLGYGRTLLEAMLGLTKEEEKLILPTTNREDVRELKRFAKEEPKEHIGIEKALIRFFAEDKELFEEIMEEEDIEERVDILNPSGSRTYKNGDVYIWFYDLHTGVKYRIFGKTETVELTWEEFFFQVEQLQDQIKIYKDVEKNVEKRTEKQEDSKKGEKAAAILKNKEEPDPERPEKTEKKEQKPVKNKELEIAEAKIGKNEPKISQKEASKKPSSLNECGENVVPAQLEKELEISEEKASGQIGNHDGIRQQETRKEQIETETVFEKLQRKTLPELAIWLTKIGCPLGRQCKQEEPEPGQRCRECWELYLNQHEEAE